MHRVESLEHRVDHEPSDARTAPPPSLARSLAFAALRALRRLAFLIVLATVVLLGARAWQSTQGPPLRPWHTLRVAEADAATIARGDWNAYLAGEQRLFDDVHRRLQRALAPADRTPLNRYHDGSFSSPTRHDRDWNRSFVLEPEGQARGIVVLLHGLSDSPYSVRTLAHTCRAQGFVAIAPRLPGHGTVPAALTRVGRREWTAAVDMALAHARRRAHGRLPVHVVAYSNGAALALQHVFARIARDEPAGVDRLVLLSPMVEVSGRARYVGLAGLPALLPRYAKAAWLEVTPEYNPFKYNSFPLRAARESYLVTAALHETIGTVAAQGRLDRVPPILAFQSVLDDTIEARGVMTRVLDRLPANGSELVLFDVNRTRLLGPMLRAGDADWARQAVLRGSRTYTTTLVTTPARGGSPAIALRHAAGAGAVSAQGLGLRYPDDVHSLSHVALPFAEDDPLYGRRPSGRRALQLGSLAVRGERGALLVSQENLGRLTWNPFHAYMTRRIVETLRPPSR